MTGKLSPEALFALKLTWADEGKHWLAEDLFDHIDALQAENEALRAEPVDWQRRHMDLITSCDRWRIKAQDAEERNRELLEILQAHDRHPGVSHTAESLGYDFARNAEMLACDCGHRAMGVTDEQRALRGDS